VQQQPASTPKRAIVELAKGGSFTITLRPDAAQNTVANFVQKARDHKYDGLKFHRVEDWVVQGGDPLGTGTGGGKMPSELNQLPFKIGAVGIARGQDIKINNDMQWFVVKKDASWLNGQYTNFGQVESGMDVVNGIRAGDVIKTIRVE
jgi:peptidyl-prolyl cis-trans isomerase B (cyclophilin B)